MGAFRALWRWVVRLLAIGGVTVGEVSEETAAHFRVAGAACASITVIAFFLGRVLVAHYWQPALEPALDRILPGYVTHPRVIKVLAPYTDGDRHYPYAFWASDHVKYTSLFNTHPRVGDRMTVYRDHAGWTKRWVVHGRVVWTPRVHVPIWLAMGLLLIAGSWFLFGLLATLCFITARRIDHDRLSPLVETWARLEEVWCPWPQRYLRTASVPLSCPVSVRDVSSGRRFHVFVPGIRLQELDGRIGSGEPVEVTYHRRTHALVSLGEQARVEQRREAGGRIIRRVLSLTRSSRFTNVGVVSPRLLLIHNRAKRASAVGGVLLLLGTLASTPRLMPLWAPIRTSHTMIARVYTPFTSEPSGTPWEIGAADGSRYYLVSNPELRKGDAVIAQWDFEGEFLSLSHGKRVWRRNVHNHPVPFLALILSALTMIWRGLRRSYRERTMEEERVVEEASLVGGLP